MRRRTRSASTVISGRRRSGSVASTRWSTSCAPTARRAKPRASARRAARSPMLAKLVRELPPPTPPGRPGMLFEPKWDGFRCIVFRDGDEVELGSRNERPLTRYFPELLDPLRAQLPERCVLDGEVVIATA